MAAGVVLTIGLAVTALSDLPADARWRVLSGYAVCALLYGYAALCFLDALLMSSVGDDGATVPLDARKLAARKRATGIVCAVIATVALYFLRA